MTDPSKTLLVLIVDRSGSMGTIASDMDGAIAKLLAEQAALPGSCEVYLAHFDDQYEVAYHGDANSRAAYRIEPRGMTALYGAIGRTITDVGKLLAGRPEADRPGCVIVAIITDGLENHSGFEEWSRPYAQLGKVRSMVEHQAGTYGWQFTYLGANQDAVLVGTGLGVPADSSMTYAPTAVATASVGSSLSSAITSTRERGGAITYDDEARKEATQG